MDERTLNKANYLQSEIKDINNTIEHLMIESADPVGHLVKFLQGNISAHGGKSAAAEYMLAAYVEMLRAKRVCLESEFDEL